MVKPSIEMAKQAYKNFDESDFTVANAWYDSQSSRIFIELKNSLLVGIPIQQEKSLRNLSEKELKEVQFDQESIYWEKQDIDLDAFGTIFMALNNPIFELHYRTYLARQMGQSKTPAKAEAARQNGKQGGRPKKLKQESVLA